MVSSVFERMSRCAAFAALMIALAAGTCHAITYATITGVTATQLRNGVQIRVEADGIIDFEAKYSDRDFERGFKTSLIKLDFPSARSGVPTFIDVSKYPVSYIQTSIPQNAKDGVGVSMSIALFTASEFTINQGADSQSVVITVKSDRTLDTVDRSSTATASNQKSAFDCTCENGLMCLNVLKTDMLTVFSEIAKRSGLNIVVDDAVGKRTVSMSLDNQTPEAIIKAITSAYGLAMLKSNGVYMISEGVPTDLATYRLSGTASFPMKNIQAQTASGLLPTFLYSYLHVNNEQNAVVVSAPTQMLEKIKRDLEKVDTVPPQIMVEAIAVEISSEDEDQFLTSLFGQGHNGKVAANTTTDDPSQVSEGDITYTTVGQLPNDFSVRLKALVSAHKAKIHSNPRMAVMNGQNADIFIGAQRFIRIEQNDYGRVTERIQGVDVGTRISVTPWTGGNGEITTTISPEVSNIVELERNTGLPTLSSRNASTTVRVKDGETVVIGGLTQRQDYLTKRKVPILGDLPIIGRAFRSTSANSSNTELIILITPHILTESGHLPESEKDVVAQKALKEASSVN